MTPIATGSDSRIESIITGLCSSQRLQRERELLEVKKHVSDEEFRGTLIKTILGKLSEANFDKSNWESAAGLTGASVSLIDFCTNEQVTVLYELALTHLDHQEFRVRKESGELLAKTVQKLSDNNDKLASTYNKLVELIRRDLSRDPALAEMPENEKVRRKILEGQQVRGKTSEEIFHESAGWRHLETSMGALKRLFELNKHSKLLKKDLFDLLNECSSHSNRFIRENAFYILSAVLDETLNSTDLIDLFANLIYTGLSDNWSQVRMSSSDACRSFLLALSTEARSKYYSLLLPPIALNRYYIAAGVRIHNQETWRQLFPSGGSDYVNKEVGAFVSFYCQQIAADNHAVREAACACLAELAQKCSTTALEQEWERMMDALIDCFGDDSWPVRDATCIALGNFVRVLPNVTKPKHETLYEKFIENCTDPIASVRQGGATSLSYLAKANVDLLDRIEEFVQKCFEELKDQTADGSKHGRLEPGPGQFGVVRRITSDEDKMENNTMYSCGSLAPKMKAKKDKQPLGTGCSACTKFTRDEDHWERVDGSIFIVSNLCKVFSGNRNIGKRLGKLVDQLGESLMRNRHFEEHVVLFETASKQLIQIARGLGKQEFKAHLEPVFDILFYATRSDVILTKAAAEECLAELAKFLGESILRGRVEITHFEDMALLDRSLLHPIRVPVHEVSGMKKPEDNYGAFIAMTPGQSY